MEAFMKVNGLMIHLRDLELLGGQMDKNMKEILGVEKCTEMECGMIGMEAPMKENG